MLLISLRKLYVLQLTYFRQNFQNVNNNFSRERKESKIRKIVVVVLDH
jgi:hypothetical protein